jgi:predicted dehydrogenase
MNHSPRRHRRSNSLSRRRFLQTSAAAGASLAFGAPAILRAKNLNEKLNIAVIGSGGRGRHNMQAVSSEKIVALCDVNETNLNAAAEQHPQAKKFVDFRKLYDHADLFDAVTVSTCEHTHAFATLPALRLGKHVYCEKPLTHNVYEARVIRETARDAGVATQMGIQKHAGNNYRRVVELIQSGAIGPVREAHVWVSRAWGLQSREEAEANKDVVFVDERPAAVEPVPEGLHWDLWLGPAAQRPFNSVYFPGPKWYRWWEFGNGTMSDLGSHWVDLSFWALKLQAPRTITAYGPSPHPEIAPASMHVVYEYDARGELPPVTLTWYQGSHKPEIWTSGGIPNWGNGTLFIGEDGMLLSDYERHVLLPEEKFAGFKGPDPWIPRTEEHHIEWLHACKTGEPTLADFEYSGWLTEANHLGNVAFRTGKTLEWDPEKLAATNAPEADRFIHREYRSGWEFGS